MYSSVVEPEPPFLSGAGALKKEADPAPATALTYTLKNEINKNLKNLINCYAPLSEVLEEQCKAVVPFGE